MNILTNLFNKLIKYLAIILPLFLVINFNFYPFDLFFSRISVLVAILILVIVKFPLTIKNKSTYLLKYIDIILTILVILIAIYSYFKFDEFSNYMGLGTPLYQTIAGALATFLVYECTRRVAGPALPTIALVLFGYAIYRGYSFTRIISEIFSREGIFGSLFSVVISVVFMFILFGNFLNQANFGNFIIKIGNTLVGGMSGGPARIAVLASSFFGTISGSAVANVVGTGTFTIPMMKKIGFKPDFAGAVEAAASAAGQFTPPIMGGGAFIMAEILQVPYLSVATAAILPAIAYYVFLYASIDVHSKKLGIKGVPKNERPSFKESMKEGGHLILIIAVLIILLVRGISPVRLAFLTTVTLLPLSYFSKKTRLNFKKILNALTGATNGLLVIGSCVATVGSIVACIGVTGLGGRLARVIVSIGGQNILLAMFLVMVTCIIFGMAMPTSAAYIVLIAVVGPSLIKLGVIPLCAHLFVFYFAALSSITPPVAIAAYAAAAIAGASMTKTAINAVKLALCAFIIPYIFVSVPAMIFQGNQISFLYIIFVYVLVLPLSLTWGLWGHNLLRKTLFLERIFYLATAVLIVYISLTNKVYYGIYCINILIIWIIGAIVFYYRIPLVNKLISIKRGN